MYHIPYTAILSKPSQEYLDQTVNAYLQAYTTRESMIELIASTYDFDQATAQAYLADYTDEDLRDMLKEQMEKLVSEKYA